MQRRVRIISTGSYIPRSAVPSAHIDARLGKKSGWTQRLFGIEKRHYVTGNETTSFMAAQASLAALGKAGLNPSDIDCIIAACGVGEQPIPSTAVLVQNKLGLGASGIPAFDVNSTCLSFITALDTGADAITLGRYKRVLIVSADIASCGLDWSNPEAAAIFGDGAAAAILEHSPPDSSAMIVASAMETYGSFQDVCRLEAGGTRISPHREADAFWDKTTFKMDGPAALTCVMTYLPSFLDQLLAKASMRLTDLDLLVLHQASAFSLKAVQDRLELAPDKLMMIFKDFGNQIATSIPHTLDQAITTGRLKRGDRFLLLGTSAGISFGGLIAQY